MYKEVNTQIKDFLTKFFIGFFSTKTCDFALKKEKMHRKTPCTAETMQGVNDYGTIMQFFNRKGSFMHQPKRFLVSMGMYRPP